jgi:hypothetical protein
MEEHGMRKAALAATMLWSVLSVGPAAAQQTPNIEELLRRIDALQRRVDELERQRPDERAPAPQRTARPATPAAPQPAAPRRAQAVAAPVAPAPVAPPPATTAPATAVAATAEPVADPLAAAAIPGLRAPEPMGSQFEDALRSDLPGIAIRVPGTNTQVRVYGFAKLSGYADMNGRNQTDAPPPQTIPLAGGSAWQQGGEFGMTARFSRIGIDTRSLTSMGTLETRIEGDFGGGQPTSSNAVFRLRQAWAELGTERFRVLFGQANSLWNEGIFETLIDATNLNQSFIRQAQIRVTGRLATGLTGMVSLEAPDTQYTSAAGIFSPGSSFNGGASPAFNAMPDLLGRLTWRHDGLELDTRAVVRQLSVRTAGTAASPPNMSLTAPGWGVAAHVRVPMRWLSPAFGQDQVMAMAYYGEGIGRYFAGNTSGQDALTNLGLPGVGTSASLDPLPAYGAIAAYRRFWTDQLRSNISYSFARQDYPSYALQFTPGSPSAVLLNRDMQQVFVNLIWSPFAEVRNGNFGSGWLDVGLEYVFTRRDVFGGAAATGPAGAGNATANRIVGAAIARF